MSTLALVRHAQASFFADDYDKLSPLGEQQARLLGQYWVKRNAQFDEVFTGPRVRQIETAALAGEAFVAAGLHWPQPQVIGELDEHHADRLMKAAMRQIIEEFPHVGPLLADYKNAERPHDKHRSFQLMFEEVVKLWVAEKVAAPGIESWAQFIGRVEAGLQRITAGSESGRSVAAFTSMGAVTGCLKTVLACDDLKAIELGWRVRNCSITDFVFSGDRLTMEGFNAFPHLEDPQLWTYR